MRTTTRAAVAAAALCAALVLPACDAGQPAVAPPAPTPTVSGQHGDADIAFARDMIPHHSQAVEMARLAPDRAGGEPLRQLAARIERAQGPEIEQMRGFLAAWGVPGPPDGPGGTNGMSGMRGMDGMMSASDMDRLTAARGPAFDRQFLQMMIRHHQGAVTMARTELADGMNPEARALARRIVDAQQAEIAEMSRMLATPVSH